MCPGCKEAETNPRTHVLYMDCMSCDARALAASQEAKDAMIGSPGGLQAAMRKLHPGRNAYTEFRALVYRWIKAMG